MADELELTLSYEGNDVEEYGEELDYGESEEEAPETSLRDATVTHDEAKGEKVENSAKPEQKVRLYFTSFAKSHSK